MLRPCPHPTTHRFNKLKQNVLTDLPFKVENGLSKVMKCLGGKSLDLHRRQWERPTYALNSHTCLLRCKCEKSYLRHQALRMTYEAVFFTQLQMIQRTTDNIVTERFPWWLFNFLCRIHISTFDNWQLRWRTSYLLNQQTGRRTITENLKAINDSIWRY